MKAAPPAGRALMCGVAGNAAAGGPSARARRAPCRHLRAAERLRASGRGRSRACGRREAQLSRAQAGGRGLHRLRLPGGSIARSPTPTVMAKAGGRACTLGGGSWAAWHPQGRDPGCTLRGLSGDGSRQGGSRRLRGPQELQTHLQGALGTPGARRQLRPTCGSILP